MRLLIAEGLPSATVANKGSLHRSTIWRWKQKWDEINKNVQFTNPYRPSRAVSLKNKLLACAWRIATVSSRPHTCSHAIGDTIIRRIMEVRHTLRRCAEVVCIILRLRMAQD